MRPNAPIPHPKKPKIRALLVPVLGVFLTLSSGFAAVAADEPEPAIFCAIKPPKE